MALHKQFLAEIKDVFPYQSNWCEVDGIPVHYIDEGQGPVLLLVHGNFMWSFSYRRLIKALSKSFRCISIDLAGMGLSGKPHNLGRPDFQYSYLEQSHIVQGVVTALDLKEITFLSFDHGGPIGFGVMTRVPERFNRIVIANSWAWSCHSYRATKIWSFLAPLSKRALKHLMTKKQRWIFEDRADLETPEVWEACIGPYRGAGDFAPMATMAKQLTCAKPYFEEIAKNLFRLEDKQVQIVWSTKLGGLFPEFVDEDIFLQRWRGIFPNAAVTRVQDTSYYNMITKPSKVLVDVLLRGGIV